MPETAAPAVDFSADADLISFLKVLPYGRYRRGVRYPQWYLLLVTVLGTLSDCRSSLDLEVWPRPFQRCKSRGPIALIRG
jgi:hypothetical protein